MNKDKLTIATHRLLDSVDTLYDQLVVATKADKIDWQQASACLNVCAAARPEIKKVLTMIDKNWYHADTRRRLTELYMWIKSTTNFLTQKLAS